MFFQKLIYHKPAFLSPVRRCEVWCLDYCGFLWDTVGLWTPSYILYQRTSLIQLSHTFPLSVLDTMLMKPFVQPYR